MRRLFPIEILIVLLLTKCFTTSNYAQPSGYRIVDTLFIGGCAKWDYLAVNSAKQQLYVSHDTEVVIIDLAKNAIVGRIGGLKGAHGIAYANEFEEGYISDGGRNIVSVFDLQTFKVIREVNVQGEEPDAILYDPFSRSICTMNGGNATATVIDGKDKHIVALVKLSGSPEFAVSDFKGRIYVNIKKEGLVDVIDVATAKVIAKWPLSPCERPASLAIDRKNNKLFSGGRNQVIAILDADSGNLMASFPTGPGIDAGAYDPLTNYIFGSTKDGSITVLKELAADKFDFIENIQTIPGAKTMALDESTHRLYTSTMITDRNNQKVFGVIVLDRK